MASDAIDFRHCDAASTAHSGRFRFWNDHPRTTASRQVYTDALRYRRFLLGGHRSTLQDQTSTRSTPGHVATRAQTESTLGAERVPLRLGDPLIPLFDAVIFITVPAQVRLERTSQRERERYGAQLKEGGPPYQKHLGIYGLVLGVR